MFIYATVLFCYVIHPKQQYICLAGYVFIHTTVIHRKVMWKRVSTSLLRYKLNTPHHSVGRRINLAAIIKIFFCMTLLVLHIIMEEFWRTLPHNAPSVHWCFSSFISAPSPKVPAFQASWYQDFDWSITTVVDLLLCLALLSCSMTQFAPICSCYTDGPIIDSRILW